MREESVLERQRDREDERVREESVLGRQRDRDDERRECVRETERQGR